MTALGRNDIPERLTVVRNAIAIACERVGRPESSVRLVAVSKGQSAAAIRQAYDAGQRVFGENYVQELVSKATELSDLPDIEWRFIGRLQRNKAKDVAKVASAIDSVDSWRLGEALHQKMPTDSSIEILIQVNVADETQKGGCSLDDLPMLADSLGALFGSRLRGLMTVPPASDDPEASRVHFRALRQAAASLGLPALSMGMSHDMEVAIEEGATLVRVGTAIFGPRPVRLAERV